MSDAPRTLMGFDYGEKRIGIAVGQTLTATATPVKTVSQRNQTPDWKTIGQLIEEWQPDQLIVGLPLNMDGSDQPLTHRSRHFAKQLTQQYNLPVAFADERLSTREAARDYERRSEPKEGRDAVAAKIILEGWMAGAGMD